MSTDLSKFEQWAVVEIMGHRRFAGFVSEQTVGRASFVRVDVPDVAVNGDTLPAFTKLFGAGSIYAITICTEETARAFAASIRERAFSTYEAPRLPALTASEDAPCFDEDDEDEVYIDDADGE